MPRKASLKPVELDRSRTPLVVAALLVVGIGLTVGSIMWGRADSGQIDVSATIVNSQNQGQDGESGSTPPVSAPAQEYVDMPNGGLVPATSGDAPAPQPEPATDAASSTATTTEATTDTVVSEAGDEQSTQEATDAGAPQEETSPEAPPVE